MAMARIAPVRENELKPSVKVAFERHMQQYHTGITNMKATLGHSLLCFETYMHWYPLYEETERILGKRLACFYAYAISNATENLLFIAFFRKMIMDLGEQPESVCLSRSQKDVVELGSGIARHRGHIADHIYEAVAASYSKAEIVVLIAFAGQMLATNVFSNVVETDVDDYLLAYLPAINYK